MKKLVIIALSLAVALAIVVPAVAGPHTGN